MNTIPSLDYHLELDRAAAEILKAKATRVAIQLPDGLKPRAKEIVDVLCEKTGAEILIWAGSNFGACDLALDVQALGTEMLIHFGHSKWHWPH